MAKTFKRKKLPLTLVVVIADSCTGCEACIEVCPVDCIYKIPGEDHPHLQTFVDVDLERCIGCDLCVKWCPWLAISSVPTQDIAQAVAQKGGPSEYVRKHQGMLNTVAKKLQDEFLGVK